MIERAKPPAIERLGDALFLRCAQTHADGIAPASDALQRTADPVDERRAPFVRQRVETLQHARAARLEERERAALTGIAELQRVEPLRDPGVALERGQHRRVAHARERHLEDAVAHVVVADAGGRVDDVVVHGRGRAGRVEMSRAQCDRKAERPAAGALVQRGRVAGGQRPACARERGAQLVGLDAELTRFDRQIAVARGQPPRDRQPRGIAVGQHPAHGGNRRLDERDDECRAARLADVVQLVQHHRHVDAGEVLARPRDRGGLAVALIESTGRRADRSRHCGAHVGERAGQAAQELARYDVLRPRGEPHVPHAALRHVLPQQRALAHPAVADDDCDRGGEGRVQAREEPLPRERPRARLGGAGPHGDRWCHVHFRDAVSARAETAGRGGIRSRSGRSGCRSRRQPG